MVPTPGVPTALTEYVARLKHDLGKYVAFQIRWLPEDAPLAERRRALESDLLATRRGPDGEVDAVTLWRSLRPALVGQAELAPGVRVDLSDHPALVRLEASMAAVAEVVSELRTGPPDEALVDRGQAAALEVAAAVKQLQTSLGEG